MIFRRRTGLALVPVLVGLAALSACSGGSPSTRRVAEDIIESVDGLTDLQRACMLARLEGYSDEALDRINEQNQNVDFEVEDPDVSEEWQAFEDDLAGCLDDPTAVTGSTEPAATTGSTEPAATTGSTAPAASTSTDA